MMPIFQISLNLGRVAHIAIEYGPEIGIGTTHTRLKNLLSGFAAIATWRNRTGAIRGCVVPVDFTPNQIVCGDAVKTLSKLASDTFDLTIFSPPYDNLRDYHGYEFDLHKLGSQLYRVTKDGGIIVMVIQDQTVNRMKTLTTFRTILDWCDNIGFNLFECAIYKKNGKDGAWWSKRLRVDHEYMPIFMKGDAPKYFNKEPIKVPCKHAGKHMTGGANRNKDGVTQESAKIKINGKKCPGTIWDCANGGDKVYLKRQHPATFPDKIPFNFINLFTRPGDLVLDPMVGSGSTAIAAKILGRNYFGIDISSEYCKLARKRAKLMQSNMVPDFKNIIPKRKASNRNLI